MEKIIQDMSKAKEVFFMCKNENGSEILSQQDIDDAWERLNRFAAYVHIAFPETEKTSDIIDSPIQLINETKAEPSSCVALGGVGKMSCNTENIQNATHLVWLTGGSLVPESEWEKVGIYK